MLDDIDRRLLRRWQAEPSLSAADLAEACGVTPLKASRRLARMQEQGVIIGRSAVINWAVLGYAVSVSLRVTLDKTQPRAFDEFIEAARGIPEVTEIQTFLGQVDVRLSLIARDMTHYQQIYRDLVLALPHIADIEALMTVATVQAREGLPL